MISRQAFVAIVDAIVAQEERDIEIARALDVVARDGANRSLVFTTPIIDHLATALSEDMDDDDLISWWLWDGPEAGKKAEEYAIHTPDGRRVCIADAGQLYDFIVTQERAK